MSTHNDREGSSLNTLGQDGLAVLLNYSLDLIDDVQVEAVQIAGRVVGCECFAAEQLAEWAKDITRERADELRGARECAEAELLLAA